MASIYSGQLARGVRCRWRGPPFPHLVAAEERLELGDVARLALQLQHDLLVTLLRQVDAVLLARALQRKSTPTRVPLRVMRGKGGSMMLYAFDHWVRDRDG